MTAASQLDQYKSFGAAIIGGAKPGSIDVPLFEFSATEQNSLFEQISKEENQEIRTGLSYSLNRQMNKSFNSYSENEQNEIRSNLLKYAQSITNDKELTGVLASIDSVYSISAGKWPELVSFLFDSNTPQFDLLRGHLLASMNLIHNPEFLQEHSEVLVSIIQRFLCSKLDLPKSMFLSILALCNPSEINEDLSNSIWEVALEIAISDNYRSIFPAMQQLCQLENFREKSSKSVKQICEIFCDADSDLESRLTTVIPLLRLFPFLDDNTVASLVTGALEVLNDDYFNSMIIVDHLEETDLELLNDDTIVSISAIILNEIENGKRNSGIALFAPFSDHIINMNPPYFDTIVSAILSSLKNTEDQFSSLVAATSLRAIIPRFEKPNEEIFTSLLPYLTSSDENIQIESNKAMRELLESGLYSNADFEKQLIGLFNQFKESSLLQNFSILITGLIDGDEDPGLSLAEPVYDFALPLLSKEVTLPENALALDIFSTLSKISDEYAEDHVSDCLEVAANILNSDNGVCFPSAALFLSVMATAFPDIAKEPILNLLPRMLEIIQGNVKVEPKQLSRVAISVSEIVREFDLRDTSATLVEIAVKMLQSETKKISYCGAQILGLIAKSLLPEDAKKVFTLVTEYMNSNNNDNSLTTDAINELFTALKRILKKYKAVTFEEAEKVIKMIYNTEVTSLSSIEFIEDPETTVFDFISAFVKRFKAKSLNYVQRLINFVEIIDSEVLPSLLYPVDTSIDLKLLSNEDVSKLLCISDELMTGDDSDIATSLLTTLTAITRSYPELMDNVKVLNSLSSLWESVDETENDFELPMAIAMLALELCARSETGEGVDDQLIIDLLGILPLSPEVCDLEHVSCAVNDLAGKEWAKEKLLTPLAVFMTKVCLMKKTEIEEYEVSAGIITQMRTNLKELVKNNKDLENVLRSEFQKNASALNSLLK